MKLCYLYLHRFAGTGSGRYMQSLISYLKSRHHDIYVVEGLRSKLTLLKGINVKYVHFPFQVPVYMGRNDVKKNIRISEIPDSKLLNLISRFAEWEIKINEKVGLDLVNTSHASILPFSACIAGKTCGVPYVVTAHGTGLLSSLECKRNFEIARRGLEESEMVIADSHYIRNGIIKSFGLKKSKVRVIYPGVDTDTFRPVSKRMRSAIKRRYGCDGKKVVLSSGYFTDKRGFQDLLDAAKTYEKEDGSIHTIITGQGPYQKDMETMIKKNGLKNTKILGWLLRKDLVKLYSAADLFVTTPTWDVPFGLVPAEALSSGTPVIASKAGMIPEIVGKENGELVSPGSPGEIADAVLRRIGDDGWKAAAGRNGRKTVLREFSSEVSGMKTESLYASITGKK